MATMIRAARRALLRKEIARAAKARAAVKAKGEKEKAEKAKAEKAKAEKEENGQVCQNGGRTALSTPDKSDSLGFKSQKLAFIGKLIISKN